MGKNKTGRPSWFKLFLHHKSLIEAVPDEVAGKALKAALRYFDTGEVAELDSLAGAVFAAIKPNIDDAFKDFKTSSEKNRENIKKRWDNRGIQNDTTGTTGYHSIPNDTKNTEEEGEGEAEEEEEGEGEFCTLSGTGCTLVDYNGFCLSTNKTKFLFCQSKMF